MSDQTGAPAQAQHTEHSQAPKRTGKRLIGTVVATLAGIGLAWYGYHWWTDGRFMESTDDAYVGGDVTVISAKVPGYIAQIGVTDNQQVHAGDILMTLDDRDYRAALDKAEGAVAAQQAALANIDATRRLQEAMIQQSKADVTAADAEAAQARDDNTRYQNLAPRAAVSTENVQRAEATYKQALAGNQKAQAGLSAAERELDVIGTRKQQIQAALAQAIAERDIARLNLGYTQLRAPIDGVIGNRHAHNGAYAAAGSQLLSIVPTHGLWVDANFKESQLAHFHPGQRVAIEADVLPGDVFHGRLASVAPATGAEFSVLPPENATGNFTKIVQRVPVRIELEGQDGSLGVLRPGLSVVAAVDSRLTGRPESRQP